MSQSTTSTPTTQTCPRCFERLTITSIEHYCQSCGLVVNDSPIDHQLEWFAADDRDDPRGSEASRRMLYDRGLGSEIDRDGDETLRAWHARAKGTRRDRTRGYATSEIHRMAGALELPRPVADRAKRIFCDLHRDTLEGRDLDAVSAGALLVACRADGQGITTDDVAAVARADAKAIGRRMRWVASETETLLPPPDIEQRIRVLGGRLGADHQTVREAVRQFRDAELRAAAHPSTTAAACLYLAGEWTQGELAEVAGCSRPGLRNRRDEMVDK